MDNPGGHTTLEWLQVLRDWGTSYWNSTRGCTRVRCSFNHQENTLAMSLTTSSGWALATCQWRLLCHDLEEEVGYKELQFSVGGTWDGPRIEGWLDEEPEKLEVW